MQDSQASAASNSLTYESTKNSIIFLTRSTGASGWVFCVFFFSCKPTYLNNRLKLRRAQKENTDETDSSQLLLFFLMNNMVAFVQDAARVQAAGGCSAKSLAAIFLSTW